MENSRRTPAPPITLSFVSAPITLKAHLHDPLARWTVHADHAAPSVSMFLSRRRNAAVGAPGNDDDLVPDEYFDPPSPQPNP
ncbi:uncharacterized protein EDB91DRAFT_1251306 [Suillus paluster]|uniref:uncharacterized protein n=1 Tax=Suillus paluster TaxID=48578 RepID=UPI001B8860CA|nr:uncharacterized protein EDB91DRAFT_1251306 [Suillus paluster]KAG1733648.1 hypothetical protein EDB91DRAFT_1251306 [Suillus paluster]